MPKISIDDAELQRNLRQLADRDARVAASGALKDTADDQSQTGRLSFMNAGPTEGRSGRMTVKTQVYNLHTTRAQAT
ncbi:MAG: hypothetical protein ACK41U_03300 [Paracoccus sp. (in: a-proteobacteria)]|uniref:hypothetical protein n=1 Tax=Paracoccus sp. TaxID=267 RepID=UPI00391B4D70